jgi:hypothetical protein
MATNHSAAFGAASLPIVDIELSGGEVIATRGDSTKFVVAMDPMPTTVTYRSGNQADMVINGVTTLITVREGMEAIAYSIERNDRRIEKLESASTDGTAGTGGYGFTYASSAD